MLDATPQQAERLGPPVAPEPPPSGRKGHGLLWAGLAFLVMAGGGGGWWWYAHRPQPAPPPPPPLKVQALTVAPRTVPVYRSYPALTEAIKSVAIQARVTGYLLEQGAVDGADVGPGALLYRIDPRDYQVSLAQAKGVLEQSQASLDYSRVSQGRNGALARDGWVSHDTFDQSNSTFRQGQATLASSMAAFQQAALNLSRTEITAPFAGRLSRTQAFEGSLISVAGATLNTLVQLDPIYVSLNPAEADLDAITLAQARAPIEAAVAVGTAAPGHSGPVTFIDNQVDHATGTIMVRATIGNPDHLLLPGQYVTARLHLGDQVGALLVPQTAVGAAQIGRFLMIAGGDGKVEQRIVKLGDSDGDDIIVTEGLKIGDRVITEQLQKLKPGMPVDVVAISPSAGP